MVGSTKHAALTAETLMQIAPAVVSGLYCFVCSFLKGSELLIVSTGCNVLSALSVYRKGSFKKKCALFWMYGPGRVVHALAFYFCSSVDL